MTKNIISLAEKTSSGTMWSIKDMLVDLVEDEARLLKYNKAVILLLNDDDQYTTGFNQAGMRMSDCVMLCEMSKDMFKNEMK